MKKSCFSESQIIAILKQAESGTPVPELCCDHGMSSALFYKWRSWYGGMDASMMARLKELEEESRRLKKEWRGRPDRIHCDNGPEYVSAALMGWASCRGIYIEFIEPGKPQQNAYIERYNRTVRYDWSDY